jgi:hypothetical protein
MENLTGTYEVIEVRRSRSSHNGRVVLAGGELTDATFDSTGVYCDMRVPGFDSLVVGQTRRFVFNDTCDITEII